MKGEKIQRILVWSGLLRLAHWSIALSVLLLWATGWLVHNAPLVAARASDVHDFCSVILMVGLGLRLWLLFFGSGSSHWQQMIPQPRDKTRVLEMLRFYLTLGKSPLPGWHAHNPFWAPIYLLLLTILFLQILTGLFMEPVPLVWGFYLPDVHAWLATAIFLFFIAHIVAVVLDDLKGSGSDISAMINGYRIFVVDKPEQAGPQEVQFITPEQIKKRRQ